ncbi:MAG: hypothetical protein RQ741_08320 [Wenzhouxiangellaceae bacterium]|nr:hypothetical protein [Wenzhouxiangellaceae bacterium]
MMPEPLPSAGRRLFDTWQTRAADLDKRDDAEARQEASDRLLEAVERLRKSTVELIDSLS